MLTLLKRLSVKLIFTILICFTYHQSAAQDSSHIRISLLTCSPGEELYASFGHSAIRITDSSNVTDLVFNFGTFDFDDPDFYKKFIRGKLLYYLSFENFNDFKSQYQSENRGMTEQVIQLSGAEKMDIRNSLFANATEQNKYYKYDFFFDNCTTRLRDLILKYSKRPIKLQPVMPSDTRFRDAIHLYLDKNDKQWCKLGIDLLLGAPTDAIMTVPQQEFLPDNLMKALDTVNIEYGIIKESHPVFQVRNTQIAPSIFTPFVVFSSLFLFIVLISFSSFKFSQHLLSGFDGVLFFLTGALGIALIYMWTSTDHAMCKNNFNLLWALPTHCLIAFFVNSNLKWVKGYFIATAVSLVVVLICWSLLPQHLNYSLIPLLLILLYRSTVKIFQ